MQSPSSHRRSFFVVSHLQLELQMHRRPCLMDKTDMAWWHGALAIRFEELCPPADSRPFSGPAQGPDTSDTNKLRKIMLKSHIPKWCLLNGTHCISFQWACGQKHPPVLYPSKRNVLVCERGKRVSSKSGSFSSPCRMTEKISKTQQTL